MSLKNTKDTKDTKSKNVSFRVFRVFRVQMFLGVRENQDFDKTDNVVGGIHSFCVLFPWALRRHARSSAERSGDVTFL
jgi:hypothetical protein